MNLPTTDLLSSPATAGTAPKAVSQEHARERTLERVHERAAPEPKRSSLEAVAEQINRVMAESAREVRFAVHEDSGRPVVRVIDPNSGELLRQMPSEALLAVAAYLERNGQLSSLGVESWA